MRFWQKIQELPRKDDVITYLPVGKVYTFRLNDQFRFIMTQQHCPLSFNINDDITQKSDAGSASLFFKKGEPPHTYKMPCKSKVY